MQAKCAGNDTPVFAAFAVSTVALLLLLCHWHHEIKQEASRAAALCILTSMLHEVFSNLVIRWAIGPATLEDQTDLWPTASGDISIRVENGMVYIRALLEAFPAFRAHVSRPRA